ncbi:MAG TPA: hypothetical protein VM198_08450 [Longimicrobiales bacterium]|nr:hypothetical protein [Longimicrobiales bacterium]
MSGAAGDLFTSGGGPHLDADKKGSEEPLQVLRAKYHDYCSAQLADLLVYMSPDEIYVLAHRAYREGGGEGDISYSEMVRVATDWLARRIALPPFEVWLDDYLEHPEKYDEYFMGLWESDVGEPGEE